MMRPNQKLPWLHEIDVPPPTPPPFSGEPELGKAWQRLQVLHTPFRKIDADEYRWIVGWLADLERLFFEHSALEPYYEECYAPESRALVPNAVAEPSREVTHVATIQAQFMEEVFYTLELDRHANAVDNRGWMNLFRRWGRSRLFNQRLDELRAVLTLQFLSFYDLYVRNYPVRIDEEPVPHPWDSPLRRRDPRAPTEFPPERTGGLPGPLLRAQDEPSVPRVAPTAPAVLPGIYLDSGIQEAGSRPPSLEEQAVSAPASARPGPYKPGGEGGRPPLEDTGGKAGRSAPPLPNE
jgi:hypothetical protein